MTKVYFSLSSFLSLLTRNYPHEGTCDVTIDNMGYERKIISDPLTLLGDKERGSCTRFSGLQCNGLLARVRLSKMRHDKEVPKRIRSNKTEFKKVYK